MWMNVIMLTQSVVVHSIKKKVYTARSRVPGHKAAASARQTRQGHRAYCYLGVGWEKGASS